jgi:serine/threonine protein kinase
MATGQLPFRKESSRVIFEGILGRLPSPATRLNPDLPSTLEEIINKALEKDRNLRYQDASDMRADLQRLKHDTATSPSSQTRPEYAADNLPATSTRRQKPVFGSQPAVAEPPRTSHRAASLALGSAAVAVAVVLALWWKLPTATPKIEGTVQADARRST